MKKIMPTPFLRILVTTALCLAAGTVNAAQVEQAEQQIRLQWQSNPKLRYHTLSCKGTLREWMKGGFHVQEVRTMQGTWIPIRELPPETLVFRGESKGYKPGKTKGGVGYFFCSPESGKLIAYLLTK